ncbi:MAG TPA: Fic family protein [Candidatus Nanoarchaeia archaeon]|nr:Fic family protein [Candidatus Nanoarchaeia archaeon]
MIKLEDLALINKRFADGKIRNQSSLEYALTVVNETEDWTRQLAHLIRSIIVDHAFEEGNKRTGAYLLVKFASERKLVVDQQKVYNLVLSIAAKPVSDIEKLRRMVKNALV